VPFRGTPYVHKPTTTRHCLTQQDRSRQHFVFSRTILDSMMKGGSNHWDQTRHPPWPEGMEQVVQPAARWSAVQYQVAVGFYQGVKSVIKNIYVHKHSEKCTKSSVSSKSPAAAWITCSGDAKSKWTWQGKESFKKQHRKTLKTKVFFD